MFTLRQSPCSYLTSPPAVSSWEVGFYNNMKFSSIEFRGNRSLDQIHDRPYDQITDWLHDITLVRKAHVGKTEKYGLKLIFLFILTVKLSSKSYKNFSEQQIDYMKWTHKHNRQARKLATAKHNNNWVFKWDRFTDLFKIGYVLIVIIFYYIRWPY